MPKPASSRERILDAAQLGAFQKEIAHIVVLVLVLVAVVVLVGVGIAVVVMQDTQLYGIADKHTRFWPSPIPRGGARCELAA